MLQRRATLARRELDMTETALLSRIQVNPALFDGKPIIRGLRIAVEHILRLLAAGDTPETILQEYPFLEPGDIQACLLFAYRSLMARDTGLTEHVRLHSTTSEDIARR